MTRSDEVLHWLNEISSARKREKDFRKEGNRILDIYSGEKQSPFNILYSNTETLLPALYSAIPRPVVQRRFKDDDPMGKMASEAAQRMLEFLLDTNVEGYETFDEAMRAATLDALLPGRGVTCIKYDAEIGEYGADGSQESTPYKKSELVCNDTRSWDRVFFGYAKKWSKVPWIAYEEHIDEKEAERLFGEKSKVLVFTKGEEEKDRKDDEKNTGDRKTALIYQIWDKDSRKIRYVSDQYKDDFLKDEDDPLQLTGFFNCPRPMMFFEKSNDLMPTALYCLYEAQARELNNITDRIINIVNAIKAKAIYDGELGEAIKNLLEASDLTLTPTDKSSSLSAEKGLQNAIWFWPVEKLIVVLNQLYAAREQCKQVIYEITGIADIMRGQTNASETLGAQEIKQSWGTLRLKRAQKEVQRYARDILRIMLEVAATKFSEETWAKMTGLPFVTSMQKQQLLQISNAAQMSGQQLDPAMQQKMQAPVWSDILNLLRSDTQRAYRIDIETNSTVEPEAVEDQKNISDLMTAIGQFLNGVGPLVQKGVLPFQVAQTMLLTITRRFRFGSEIEDQIKAMQAPQPEDNGEKAKLQQQQQEAQQEFAIKQAEQQRLHAEDIAKHQRELDAEKNKLTIEIEKMRMEHAVRISEIEANKQATLSTLQATRQTEQMKAQIGQDTELKKAAMQIAGQIEIAEISATKDAQRATADNAAAGKQVAETSEIMQKILERQNSILQIYSAPKDVIRDQSGRIARLVPNLNT